MMRRMIFLLGLAVLALGAGLLPSGRAMAADCTTPVLATTTGRLCGVRESGPVQGIEVFRGIPYAEPVSGARRWTAPVAKTPWAGVFAATAFGPACPQKPGEGPISEDCLFLNVWRPAIASSHLPIMVYIHGGAFETGAGSDPVYDGALMAKRGVIIVTLNYRLGALGFLAAGAGPDKLDGNFGFQDQTLAMRWVKANAAALGGDPDRITLFGESVGAMSTGLHLESSPASKDLFSAAIMESNLAGVPYRSLPQAQAMGDAFLALAKCDDVACMRQKSLADILAMQAIFSNPQFSAMAFPGFSTTLVWAPTIDGRVLVRSPLPLPASPGAGKPVMIGDNGAEGVLFMSPFAGHFDRVTYIGWMANVFGKHFDATWRAYPGMEGDNLLTGINLYTDYVFTCGAREFAAPSRGPTYVYFFSQPSTVQLIPIPPCVGQPCHTTELPYVFGTVAGAPPVNGQPQAFTPQEATLSAAMTAYWTNFAKTRDPNKGEATPAVWPVYQPGKDNILQLGTTVGVLNPQTATKCGFARSVGYGPDSP